MLTLGPVTPVTNRQSSVDMGGETKIQLTVTHPEIILVENPMNIDSHAIILTVNVLVCFAHSIVSQHRNF
jgi:hypothetical protein